MKKGRDHSFMVFNKTEKWYSRAKVKPAILVVRIQFSAFSIVGLWDWNFEKSKGAIEIRVSLTILQADGDN